MVDFNEFKEQLKQNFDIVNVIGSKVNIHRVGSKYNAICPFHRDTNKSFFIYPDTQTYYCFGCKASGDIITFIQEYEKLSFIDAMKLLADRAGLPMPQTFNVSETIYKKEKRDRMLELNRQAGYFYIKQFRNTDNPAKEYVKKRNFTDATIRSFGLGYSPNATALIHELRKLGFTDDEMIEAKIARNSYDGLVDFFAGRLIIPIVNELSDVLGFGARDLTDNKKISKYVNSSESLIFSKKNILFGFNLFRKYVKENPNLKDVIIVEGYMDVMALWQAGIYNVVASMGTALTAEQIRKIKGCKIRNVYFCYDGDSAGQNAMMNSFPLFKDQGINVKVITIPDNKDPDEYIAQYGVDGYLKLVENAKPYIKHAIDKILEKYDVNNIPEDREKFAIASIEFLLKISNTSTIEAYLDEVYIHAKISEDNLKVLMRKIIAKNNNTNNLNVVKVEDNKDSGFIRFYLYTLFADNIDMNVIDSANYKFNKVQKAILNEYEYIFNVGKIVNLATLKDMQNEDEYNEEIVAILASSANKLNPTARRKYLEDKHKKNKESEIKKIISEKARELENLSLTAEEKDAINQDITALIEKLGNL